MLVTDESASRDAEVLRSGTATLKRTGAWNVPARLRIMSATGAVKLDFRSAIPTSTTIDIEVESGTGAIDLILPEGSTVDLSGLSQITGRVRCAVPQQPMPPYPHFSVHGVLGTGGVRVAYKPKRFGIL